MKERAKVTNKHILVCLLQLSLFSFLFFIYFILFLLINLSRETVCQSNCIKEKKIILIIIQSVKKKKQWKNKSLKKGQKQRKGAKGKEKTQTQ